MTVLFILIMQLAGLLLAVFIDPYILKRKRRLLIETILLVLTLVLQNYTEYRLETELSLPFLRIVVGIFGYCVRPLALAMFCSIFDKQKSPKAVWILILINALIHFTALFCGVCFTIDEDNIFHRGPLGFTCHIVSAILLIYLVYLTLREYRMVRKRDMIIPVLNAVVIIVSVILDSVIYDEKAPASFLTIAVATVSVFYYIWLHMQFVREHEEDLKARQRIQIMMSQIQPHFLYNTIATLKAMCKKDPDQAAELTEYFGTYLRQNLDSLSTVGRIPFEKELDHTRIYANIEMVRFENIEVHYNIEDTNFTIPPLTLQPIVENAIRHGVRIREKGLVKVSTAYENGWHEISVSDNGVGFDTQNPGDSEGMHIGLKNVSERIEQMCGGTVNVESRKGEGTTVVIRIPDNRPE